MAKTYRTEVEFIVPYVIAIDIIQHEKYMSGNPIAAIRRDGTGDVRVGKLFCPKRGGAGPSGFIWKES